MNGLPCYYEWNSNCRPEKDASFLKKTRLFADHPLNGGPFLLIFLLISLLPREALSGREEEYLLNIIFNNFKKSIVGSLDYAILHMLQKRATISGTTD